MVFAEAFNLVPWVLLGSTIVFGLIVAYRASGSRASTAAPESSRHADDVECESGAAARVGRLEVRLHDFARDVEARLETRAVQLDQLVAAADREIIRLSELLKSNGGRNEQRPDLMQFDSPVAAGRPGTRGSGTPAQGSAGSERIPRAQEQMVHRLYEAGYGIPEIAHIVGRSPDEVRVLLRAA